MPAWLPPALCIEAGFWAAFFAQVGHLRVAEDRAIARVCGRISAWCLVAGLGFLVLARTA